MKKFFAVLLCTVMAASATACANSSAGNSESSKAESAVSQASEEETSAPETTKEESSKAESSTSIMFGNIQEYLEYPSTQKYLESAKESAKSANLFTVECYADDDTLVYEYKYTKQLPDDSIDQVVEYFKKITETLESGMVPVMKDLVAYVDETDPKIKVVYLNADGSELYSITFDKSILDEESTDESSSAEL
ncbi:DUF4854 domain-containing protein [Ruminococcus bromii]|mgnify:FL=1|jgi:hypothetical protein|uniref:DUF4854 domain-containing protein n=1 Tax=Ruminococcus bromii TaxID=40518 RepID=A0ABT0NEQ9_9FIRM|nr:DUF4854 domain-containing protein [Ruminococcus bromii]MCL3786731.1 DUF4854 domain-containing protein [Ruminococcus bromii]MDR3970781.1 DUF4854 domain-containing protein [Ruminococcus sp.]